jgi:coniferyl-aldehyde dehydrogenase
MAQTAQLKTFASPENDAQRIFTAQRAAYLEHPFPSLEERKNNLTLMEKILTENVVAICEAVTADFGHRAAEETKFLEIFTSVDGIRDARKKIAKWMKPQKRHVSILFAGGKNRVIPQPKGVVGIIVPWNYPLFLTIGPLTSALAAGNRCMVKMAANSSNLRELLAEKFAEKFAEDHVAILPGIAASDFSSIPYDHLMFTGSADAGRTVMRSAAENLTPVTLELGGKSPTIVCDDYDIEEAARRVSYTKFLNAGQTCTAPDYVFVPEAKKDAFIAAAKEAVSKRYPDTNSPDFTSVIDEKSYRRLRATLDDATDKGTKIVNLVDGAVPNDMKRKLPPTIVLQPAEDTTIMREEIFGPLLPVRTYKTLDEVIGYVNSKDRPLGLYVFTNDREVEERILYATISGGVTVNNCMIHVGQHDLPFGGVGASGMGHYHGIEGFTEFSKLRPVFTAPKFDSTKQIQPPYKKQHTRMFNLMLRFKR